MQHLTPSFPSHLARAGNDLPPCFNEIPSSFPASNPNLNTSLLRRWCELQLFLPGLESRAAICVYDTQRYATSGGAWRAVDHGRGGDDRETSDLMAWARQSLFSCYLTLFDIFVSAFSDPRSPSFRQLLALYITPPYESERPLTRNSEFGMVMGAFFVLWRRGGRTRLSSSCLSSTSATVYMFEHTTHN
jgi:hypothetical protein